MKTSLPLIAGFLTLLFSFDSRAQKCQTVYGDFTGRQLWESDTVKITGDVAIDGTLVINPGTYVEFQGHYELSADSILAIGNSSDSITFTIHDSLGFSNTSSPDGGWKRITAKYYAGFDYCRIMFGKFLQSDGSGLSRFERGILFISSMNTPSDVPLIIQNSCISNNYSYANIIAIEDASKFFKITNSLVLNNTFIFFRQFSYGISSFEKCTLFGNSGEMNNLVFTGSYFERNSGLTLSVGDEGTLNLTDCFFKSNDNLSIVAGSDYSYFTMTNTTITKNEVFTLSCALTAGLKLTGNVICNNSLKSGFLFDECIFGSEKVSIVNNTFYNNHLISGDEAFIILSNNGNALRFCNNIVFNNSALNGFEISFRDHRNGGILPIYGEFNNNLIKGGLESVEYDYIDGQAENIINDDPLFVYGEMDDFHLKNVSPCINAGTTIIDGFYLPAADPDGNPRVLDFAIEIGAFEFNLKHLVFLDQPIGGSTCQGNEFFLSTNAYGGVVGFQWQKDGKNMSNKTGGTLFFASIDTSSAGKYNCIIITADGLVSTDTVPVIVNRLPVISLGVDTTIHTNETFTLDAGDGFENYEWNTGAQDKMVKITEPETGTFEYWVRVTDQDGCISGDTMLIFVELQNPVRDNASSGTMSIYPNPTSGKVYIKFSVELYDEELMVTDLAGKVFMKKILYSMDKDVDCPVDLSDLNDGIYIIKVGNYLGRIIKDKRH